MFLTETNPGLNKTLLLLSATTMGFLLPAFMLLKWNRVAVAAGQPSPLDLVWQTASEDPNGLPQDPQWSWQLMHNNPQSSALPDATKLCDGFPYKIANDPTKGVSYGNPPCVSQNVSLDYPYGF